MAVEPIVTGEMTKQEKIREGIARSICCFREEPKECKICEINGGCPQWSDVKENTERVLAYLHSQGVVIKVDRELPKNPIDTKYSVTSEKRYVYGQAQQDMREAGYEATEPLILSEVKP